MNDLWAEDVPADWILRVLDHCWKYHQNAYVFQSKNPGRFIPFVANTAENSVFGCTIESNRHHRLISKTPLPISRAMAMQQVSTMRDTFITIEPIMDFDLNELVDLICIANPKFVNIGADSKGIGLVEPTYAKVMELYTVLCAKGIEVRQKINLDRLARNDVKKEVKK
jgi:hypothetical protein